MLVRLSLVAVACMTLAGAPPAGAQTVTKETVPGVTNFARLETTVACGGATKPEAVSELKKMGYASIINLRQASEPGADIDAEAAAAKAAGINFVHFPFNATSPDPTVVDNFLKTIAEPRNNPAFLHCASANRAAAFWMIKRMQVDKWDAERAGTEAAALA